MVIDFTAQNFEMQITQINSDYKNKWDPCLIKSCILSYFFEIDT